MEKIRWGILGCANIAAAFARGVGRSSNGALTAIASRNIDKAQKWADEHGGPKAFPSYDALLQSGEVDAVYIPLPNSLHAEWTIAALDVGLPVLCEKPVALNADEARKVLAARDRTGLPVAEAFMYRFHPQYDRVFELIAGGAIGSLVSVRGVFTFLLDEPGHIIMSEELGGGSLMDVGCYPVNLARRVAGCEPVRASAFRRGTGVDMTTLGLLEFPNGILAQFESGVESFERHYAQIAGTHGAITLTSPWVPSDERPAEIILHRETGTEHIKVPIADSYQLEAEDFARAVLTKSPLRWPLEDAVANMAALDALAASARTGDTQALK